ncbi:hypothetical protein [Vibrio phage S4-7]|nr:hypothetical protein [Vibrio phage S4-7]
MPVGFLYACERWITLWLLLPLYEREISLLFISNLPSISTSKYCKISLLTSSCFNSSRVKPVHSQMFLPVSLLTLLQRDKTVEKFLGCRGCPPLRLKPLI